MAKRPKNKMSPEHRAKQFMPFSALNGYEQALREEERKFEEYIEKEGKIPEIPGIKHP